MTALTALTIRPLARSDRAGWDPLWQGYLTFYKATLPAGTDDVTFARAVPVACACAISNPVGSVKGGGDRRCG